MTSIRAAGLLLLDINALIERYQHSPKLTAGCNPEMDSMDGAPCLENFHTQNPASKNCHF